MSNITPYTTIQQRQGDAPVLLADHRRWHYRFTRRDKRYLVYLYYVAATIILLVCHGFLTFRYEHIRDLRAAVGLSYHPPQSTLFGLCLTLSALIGLYAYLCCFARRVTTPFFLCAAILMLSMPPLFLGLECWKTQVWDAEQTGNETIQAMRFLQAQIELDLETGVPLDALNVERLVQPVTAALPYVRAISITTPTRSLITCGRSCVTEDEETIPVCQTATFRVSLSQQERIVGQLCASY